MMRNVLLGIVVVVMSTYTSGMLLLRGMFGRSQRYYDNMTRRWGESVVWASGIRLRIEGLDQFDPAIPRFYVGNHQSALDIPIMVAVLRGRVRFLAKRVLYRIPLFGWALRMYGSIPVDRDDPRAAHKHVQEMMEGLKAEPLPFLVFPEGTRSRDGKLLPFRRGALKIAKQSGLDVVPFSIDGALHVQGRGFRIRPGDVRLVFAPPIAAADVAAMDAVQLHDTVRAAVLKGLGQEEAKPGLPTAGATSVDQAVASAAS